MTTVGEEEVQVGEVGKALQHETFSVVGSASTEKVILREPGLKFSFPPRENLTEVPSVTLLPHPGVQRVKGRVCF